ncbi:hypothetical protein [Pseudokineococcus sp. 1T1Z-3]|uniref:hypothetical protein n=1 Tax=Pseudokineococcus sp. 1T1Z-3 TaxID=3132745 RepID=UPI0030B20F86
MVGLFFVLPLVGMALVSTGLVGRGEPGLGAYAGLLQGSQASAVANSVLVSLVGSSIAAVVGALTAFCLARIASARLSSLAGVFSSVLATDGGPPLAFAFVVTLGNTGFLTEALGLGALGFTLYSWQGLVVMYQYFLVPTMVLVTLPTFVGLRREWAEASTSLGGTPLTYWRRVGLPVALPALLGGWVLLFGAAYATYASAAVLIGSGALPLVPLSIASQLRSGISSGGEASAMALGVLMVVVAVVVLVLFNRLQARSARWLR